MTFCPRTAPKFNNTLGKPLNRIKNLTKKINAFNRKAKP